MKAPLAMFSCIKRSSGSVSSSASGIDKDNAQGNEVPTPYHHVASLFARKVAIFLYRSGGFCWSFVMRLVKLVAREFQILGYCLQIVITALTGWIPCILTMLILLAIFLPACSPCLIAQSALDGHVFLYRVLLAFDESPETQMSG